MTEHLQPTISDRGFLYLAPISGTYPGEVQVHESSAASEPCLWLRVKAPTNLNHPERSWDEAPVHLTLEAAEQLAEQIRFLIEHHYQACFRSRQVRGLSR